MLLRNGETFLKPRIWDGSVVPKFSSENLGLQNRPRKLGLGKLVESLITPQRVAHFVEMWYALCITRIWVLVVKPNTTGRTQWRRQLWGTGVRARLDFQQCHF